jgi:thiamine biosynthesis lipoprotein
MSYACIARRPWVGAVVFALLFCVLLVACGREGARQRLAGGTMGTTWSVLYADVEGVSGARLQDEIEAELLAINAAMSTYLTDSEITALNRAPGPVSRELSPAFATVLQAALGVSSDTGGAYDVTVGPLVELWGFGARDSDDRVPDSAAIAEAAGRVGFERLGWDPERRRLQRPAGMEIDLSSIAKGYAVDRVLEILRENGVTRALVEIGGELRTMGGRPEGGPWRLAVESPLPGAPRALEALAVTDGAVATSGDYRNFFVVDGTRYAHIVDPRSGYPVAQELLSVTVIDDSCMLADAWATALLVLGRDAALALAQARDLAVYLVTRAGDEIQVDYSDAFIPYLADPHGGPNTPGG